MSIRGDIAYKIVGGDKLTIEEFRIALEDGMITGGKPDSDKELAEAYLQWIGQYYEDGERHGSLCSKTPTRVIKKGIRDGKEWKTCCRWGIHMDEVNPDKLTQANIKFLRHHFGRAKVKEMTGK